MKIDNVEIKRSEEIAQPFLIAEIGVNYYEIAEIRNLSLIDAAKLMIKEAIDSGVDAVKFQSYKAETMTSKFAVSYWDTKMEPIDNQYELFKKFDKLNYEDYVELIEYTNHLNGIFLTTCFDLEAVNFFGDYLPAYKVASADLTNYQLIKAILKFKKPILLSTGATTLSEVWDTFTLLIKSGMKSSDISLLHCVLQYPTLPENANLMKIKRYLDIFPKETIIGYSDHIPSDPHMSTLITATLLGARIIEKHFTLDKHIKGSDHLHCMEPSDVKIFRKNIDYIEKLTQKSTLDYLDVEIDSRKHARRSLIAKREIKKGEILSNKNIIIKRPGYGISPIYWENIKLNKAKAMRDIGEDEILSWKDISF